MKRLLFLLLLSFFGCKKSEYFFTPPGGGNNNTQTNHILDGINDFSSDEIAGLDKAGDISEKSLDLDTLWAVKDDSMLYIGFNAYANPGYGMSYGIYIFTDSIHGSGATSDPWNRLVNYQAGIYPEYVIYFWHDDNLDSMTSAQFISYNGNWNYEDIGRDIFVYNGTQDFLEIFIPLNWLGSPESIFVEVFTTGGENSHAQDTSPEDGNIQFSDPDWGQSTTSLSNAACVK